MSQRALERLLSSLGSAIVESHAQHGDETAIVDPARWVEVARFARDDSRMAMNHFVDLTCADYPDDPDADTAVLLPDEGRGGLFPSSPKAWRFEVVLHVRSLRFKHRLRLKARLPERDPEIDTLTGVWAGTGWFEREAYDMFGVRFRGHPDLRRILLYEEFVGHPLRKDYPANLTQPLVPYREVPDTEKLPPFGASMGMPFGRKDWDRFAAKPPQATAPHP
ncbi:MAG: NADH-quinone oxidoreductase subunit C, partial [Deltaproteobacteria bacterium]|nr:NADH-quinone oxidoreductase subunit C [Deltaproteobacteria bacterium]